MDIKNIKTNHLNQYLSQGVSNLDSLVGMKNLPDSCIDLVLTDPPYGIASKGKLTKSGGKIVSTSQAWGNDFQDAWEEHERLLGLVQAICCSVPPCHEGRCLLHPFP